MAEKYNPSNYRNPFSKEWGLSEDEYYKKYGKEDKPNAHENIDREILLDDLLNQIDPSTVKETRRGLSPFGARENVLYSALTKGGEKREIFREGYPDFTGDKEQQVPMLLNLLKELKMNPSFADTLTAETRPDIKAELDYSGKPGRYLMHLLGF